MTLAAKIRDALARDDMSEQRRVLREHSAEILGALEDAERYRWLVANSVGYAMHMGAVLYTPELVSPRDMTTKPQIDAAIDAATRRHHD